jgi:hypothetical protein
MKFEKLPRRQMRQKITILLLLLVFGVPVLSMAQTGMGSITGHVSDSSGAAIPGATVTVTNTATGVSVDSVTNANGVYLVQQLIPGPYKVEAAVANFKRAVRSGLTLDVDDKLGIDLKLQVGGTTETVTITASVPLLRSEDAQTGEVMTNSVIENFPNLAGSGDVRNVLGAMQFAGNVQGVSGSGGRAGLSLGINGSINSISNVRVNGGRTSDTEYLVDGIPITQNMGRQLSNTVPTIEDTSEFKVVTNGLGAQYGHLSGGAVDLSTQAGTKDIHGSFFDFSQAAALNANAWDNNDTKTKKPGFHQNDFGVAMGGPVYLPYLYHGQKKTFWFANYEGSRYNIGGNAVLSSVLTANERAGDESDMGTGDPNTPRPQMYDPYGPSTYPNQVCDGGGVPGPTCQGNATYERTTLLGGDGMHVPTAYLDPIIQQYLKYVPLPNRSPNPGSATGDNYKSTPKNVKGTNVYSIRVDENFSEKSRMFARFTHNDGYNSTDPTFVDPSGKPLSTAFKTLTPNGWGATVNYDYTLAPTMLLNVRAGGNYSPFSSGSFLPSGFNNSAFGFDSVTAGILGPNNLVPIDGPMTEANNVNAAGSGNSGNLGIYNAGTSLVNSTNIVYAASLTKILNRHTLQFGYEGRRYYDNIETSAEQTGGDEFRFTSQAVNHYAEDTWNPQGYANGVGQFLMGLYSWNQSNGGFANSLRQNYYAAYAQDDFKARPNLTLSLGIRWETESPVTTNKNGTLTVWDSKAPSPFTINNGFTWDAALSQAQDSSGNPTPLSPTLLSEVKTPDWVSTGFPKGALEFVGTPQHPSRNANDWHPWNFSPRLGAAWQVRKDTVIRASLGSFYLPTGGSLNGYNSASGVAYTAQDGNTTHTQVQTEGINLHPRSSTDPLCGCIESPSFPGQVLSKTTDNATLNKQSAITGQAGAVDTKSHMPLEYDWSLGLQYELKHGFLLEADYNGNTSHNLLAKDMPGHFPASLFTGGSSGDNATIYKTYVPSPTAGQAPSGGLDGATQSIGYLEYAYPYFGELQVTNRNIGKSNFNALNLRVEHRLTNGLQILANYTFSRSMDDVGGAETNQNGPSQGYGQGGKVPQDVQTVRDVYALSTLDEPRRFTAFALYQLPVGRGRRWMNQRLGIGSSVIEDVIGGWNISGDYVTTPGSPLTFSSVNQSSTDSQDLNFHNIYGNFAPGATAGSLKNPHWGGAKYSAYDSQTQSPSAATPAFDVTQFAPAQTFTIGTLPSVYSIIRNPDNWTADMSLSKNVSIFSADGTRYLQIRVDDTNFLNHPGLGGYDTNVGDNNFGTINKFGNHPNGERHIQIGARLVF